MKKLLIVKDCNVINVSNTDNLLLGESVMREYMSSPLCISWDEDDYNLTPTILKSRYTGFNTNPIGEASVRNRILQLKKVMNSEDYHDVFKLQNILKSEIEFLNKMLEK